MAGVPGGILLKMRGSGLEIELKIEDHSRRSFHGEWSHVESCREVKRACRLQVIEW